MFQLTWHQHGGSGLTLGYAEALELPLADRDWLIERMGEQRRREAREIEQAAKGR